MEDKVVPSQTALFAAAARAAHSLVDEEPYLLRDDVAQRLCETTTPSTLDYQRAQPDVPVLAAARLSACARARYADHVVTACGIEQVVVVGAGLDTTLFRLSGSSRRRVWLLDLPGVLAWRASMFEQAGITDQGRSVPVDLTAGIDLGEMEMAGLDLRAPAVVLWLGVSMYLSAAGCRRFFADFAGLPDGSTLVFDYILPPELRDEAGNAYARSVARMAGDTGEPWLCTMAPETVRTWLTDVGWTVTDDRDEGDATPPGFWDRHVHLRPMSLVRLVSATLGMQQDGSRAAQG